MEGSCVAVRQSWWWWFVKAKATCHHPPTQARGCGWDEAMPKYISAYLPRSVLSPDVGSRAAGGQAGNPPPNFPRGVESSPVSQGVIVVCNEFVPGSAAGSAAHPGRGGRGRASKKGPKPGQAGKLSRHADAFLSARGRRPGGLWHKTLESVLRPWVLCPVVLTHWSCTSALCCSAMPELFGSISVGAVDGGRSRDEGSQDRESRDDAT